MGVDEDIQLNELVQLSHSILREEISKNNAWKKG